MNSPHLDRHAHMNRAPANRTGSCPAPRARPVRHNGEFELAMAPRYRCGYRPLEGNAPERHNPKGCAIGATPPPIYLDEPPKHTSGSPQFALS